MDEELLATIFTFVAVFVLPLGVLAAGCAFFYLAGWIVIHTLAFMSQILPV